MIVREAYRDVTHSVCRTHYEAGTEALGVALGPVQDSRDIQGCEWCRANAGDCAECGCGVTSRDSADLCADCEVPE